MQGTRKFARQELGNLTQGSLGQARPANNTAGVCAVCGRYMEHLRDARCHTPECEALLVTRCVESGLGISTKEGADTWAIIKPESLVEKGAKEAATLDALPDELLAHQCRCGRALKMPRASVCALCYRAGNVEKMRDRRQTAREKAQSKKRSFSRPLKNGIKGLDRIKLDK